MLKAREISYFLEARMRSGVEGSNQSQGAVSSGATIGRRRHKKNGALGSLSVFLKGGDAAE